MSFVGGGADCSVNGNVISQFNKHTQQDRSLQRQVANQQGIQNQGFKQENLMNVRDRKGMDQFMNGQGQGAFQFQPMRHELDIMQRQGPQQNSPQQTGWSQEFKSSPSPSQQHIPLKSASPANAQWASEFGPQMDMQQHPKHQQHQQQHQQYGGMRMGAYRPMMGNMMMQQPLVQQQQQQPQEQVQNQEAQVDWDNQFKEMEEMTAEAKEAEAEVREAEADSPDFVIDDKYQATFQDVWDGLNSEAMENDFISQQYEEFKNTSRTPLSADMSQWEKDFAKYASTRAHFGDYQFEDQQNNQFLDLPKESDPYEIGLQLMESGARLSEAALAFEAAIQRDEGHINAWLKLGEVQTQNEKEIAGILALEKCLELHPENSEALMTLAISYINEGYDNAAFATLERWISTKYPQVSDKARQQNPEITDEDRFSLNKRVTELFLKAAQLSPNQANMDPDVQMGLGVLFYANEDFDKTIDCFKAALSIKPDDAVLWNRLGASLANSNRSEEAVNAYFKALELKPTFVRARYNLGVSCINIGCYKEAAEHLLSGLAMHQVEGMDDVSAAHLNHNQSTSLTETLKRAFIALDRRDLLEVVKPGMDLNQFRVASPSDTAVSEFSLVGQILLPLKSVSVSKHFLTQFPKHVSVSVNASDETLEVDDAVALLNVGVKTLFINESQVQKLIVDGGLPAVRFAVKVTTVSDELLATDVSLILTTQPSKEELKRISNNGNRSLFYLNDAITQELAEESAKAGIFPIIPAAKLSTQIDSDKISIGKIFISTLTTDRPDGLFTTLITTPAATALGVVYSSKASIEAAIAEKVGVYQSRKRTHELWYKGKTSGATQELIKLEKDCDSDVVKFVVNPKDGYGFCHVETNFTCFQDGELKDETYGSGLTKLDNTLIKRLETAPQGSYTKRLFDDDKLLIAKLKEELDELIEAGEKGDKSEVAWEAADLFYFAMVWCIKNGVRLEDIEKNLDIKSSKVTRRKGDAKEKYLEKESVKPEAKAVPAPAVEAQTYKMQSINAADASNASLVAKALTRPVQKTADIMKLVLPIIELVKKDGDKALIELTAKFDGVALKSPVLNAPFPPELMQISADMKEAIDISIANIEKFHAAQLPKEKMMTVETCPGVRCSRFAKPIENVGLYVPGGTAVLPSTAMMLGVPAKVAGCANIIFASPPARATGKLTPEVVYVAHKLGAKCIVMAGGAQAVTAMAYGTESVVKCDKILGPGNQFVTAAKMYVQNDTQALCSIDMPAGPSEVLVVADENADADFVASDLLSQAEHGVDSQVILVGVGLSDKKLAEFDAAIKKQAEVLPRKDIVAKCLAHSYTLLVDSYEEAFSMSNRYAPEHLILQIDDASKYVPDYIENAGSVFVGALSPESCGDYSSGTNHTLPTYGYARQYSGVNTATFQKFITAQDVTEEGLKSIGKAVMTLAAVEGLEAHRNAVQVRMDKLGLH